MEQAGAVFLPAASGRFRSSVGDVGDNGDWWTSTPSSSGSYYAYGLNFYSGVVGAGSDYCEGRGVRFVAAVSN